MVAIAGLKPAAYKRRTGSSPVSRTKKTAHSETGYHIILLNL